MDTIQLLTLVLSLLVAAGGAIAAVAATRAQVSELKGRVDEMDRLSRGYVTKEDLSGMESRLREAIDERRELRILRAVQDVVAMTKEG